MASKFSKDYQIPQEFPTVLKAFVREILREQPDNIYEFGAQYFADLADHQKDDTTSRRMDPQELEAALKNLFHEHDADHNGFLDHKEFQAVLREANLGLSDKEIISIMGEADENDDGVIEYSEFIPIAVDLVMSFYARVETREEEEIKREQARDEATQYMLRGMKREDLDKIMLDVFQNADEDGSGTLSRREFLTAIKDADLGFTRREINVLMAKVDADGDGNISYEEFVPLCFDILVEILTSQIVESQDPSQLERFLRELFRSGDPDDSGMLTTQEMQELLRGADLGLTRLQIHSVLSDAQEDEEGFVNYRKFCSSAAELIARILDPKYHGQME